MTTYYIPRLIDGKFSGQAAADIDARIKAGTEVVSKAVTEEIIARTQNKVEKPELEQYVRKDDPALNKPAIDIDIKGDGTALIHGLQVPMLDGEGNLVGAPAYHASRIAESEILKSRFNGGNHTISPVTYWWADFYEGEASDWGKTLAYANHLGFVIINISSGSGDVPSEDWKTQAKMAKDSGVQVLGYVRTDFGHRDHAEILTEIRNHRDWYDVDGVFLDEAINGWSPEQFEMINKYQYLHDTIKLRFGNDFWVVSNPGSNTVEEMIPTADILMSFEQSAENYLNSEFPVTPEHYRKYPQSKFWHVIHDVTKENYKAVLEKAGNEHVGHVYLTDLSFTPSSDPQTPAVNPYAAPPSQWLLEAQIAWSRDLMTLYERTDYLERKMVDLEIRVQVLEGR